MGETMFGELITFAADENENNLYFRFGNAFLKSAIIEI